MRRATVVPSVTPRCATPEGSARRCRASPTVAPVELHAGSCGQFVGEAAIEVTDHDGRIPGRAGSSADAPSNPSGAGGRRNQEPLALLRNRPGKFVPAERTRGRDHRVARDHGTGIQPARLAEATQEEVELLRVAFMGQPQQRRAAGQQAR